MGKKEIHVVHVPRAITVVVWLLVSAAMVALVYALSGHAYHRAPSFAQMMAMVRRYDSGTATNSALLAESAPALAGILFFLPWGALAFLSLDRLERRGRVYLAVVALGVAFALGLVAWQRTLPTRVMDWPDAAWNALGSAAGATLGHARKRVRIRFE